MSAEDLEKYETEMELQLYREYRDVVKLFTHVVETERRFYLTNQVELNVRTADNGEVFFEVTMQDAWVWDMYRPARFVKNVRVVTFKDVNVEELSDELLARAETQARTALDGRAPEDVPQVADWRDAYRAFGAKPQRTRPSVEALLRRLDVGLPRIDRLTDAYNAVSIANLVPVGGEDLDRYQGSARLVRAAGDEDFGTTAHGEPATEHPRPGEVIWRDDAGVTCRQWNWRQCTRTRITTATTNAVFIIDGLAALGRDGLTAAGNDLTSSLIRLSPQAAIASRLITAGQPHASRRTPAC